MLCAHGAGSGTVLSVELAACLCRRLLSLLTCKQIFHGDHYSFSVSSKTELCARMWDELEIHEYL